MKYNSILFPYSIESLTKRENFQMSETKRKLKVRLGRKHWFQIACGYQRQIGTLKFLIWPKLNVRGQKALEFLFLESMGIGSQYALFMCWKQSANTLIKKLNQKFKVGVLLQAAFRRDVLLQETTSIENQLLKLPHQKQKQTKNMLA